MQVLTNEQKKEPAEDKHKEKEKKKDKKTKKKWSNYFNCLNWLLRMEAPKKKLIKKKKAKYFQSQEAAKENPQVEKEQPEKQ